MALEGVSLVPVLRAQGSAANPPRIDGIERKRTLFWQWGVGKAAWSGRWKIVASDRFSVPYRGEWQLYDMTLDRSETSNVAANHPRVVAQLAAEYETWWQELPEDHEGGASGFIQRALFWLLSQWEPYTA